MRRSLIAWALVACGPVPAVRAQDEISEATLKALAAAYRPLACIDDGSYRCESVLTTTSLEGGKPVSFTAKYLTRVSGGNVVYGNHVTQVTPAGADTHSYNALLALNGRYLMKANRSRTADAWLLVSILPNDASLASKAAKELDILKTANKRALEGIQAVHLLAGEVTPDQLTKLPGFALGSVSESPDRRQVTVAFRYTPKRDGADQPPSDCRVVYDLDRYGLPVEMSDRSKTEGGDREYTVRTSLEKAGESEFVRVTRRKLEYKTAGRVTYSDDTEARATYTLGPVPEGEFTASAFGLPEPPGFEARPTPAYVWLLAAAGACFAGVVGFRFLAHRAASR